MPAGAMGGYDARTTMEVLPYIEEILDVARLAPSRGNLQPWRFVVDGSTISFHVDGSRDTSLMNAGDRMARIAVGAALECALVSAARMGSVVRFETTRPGALVTISVTAPKRALEPENALVRRATNRRAYDGRAVDDATLLALRGATPPIESARTLWFGRERVRVVAPVIEEGEVLLLANPRTREGVVSATRFDARDRDEVPFGLSLGSMELSARERATLDELRRARPNADTVSACTLMAKSARKLVESASGICVISARHSEPVTDVNVGRCVQRAWLALSRRRMVAHPMCSIPIIEAMLEFDDEARGAADAQRGAAIVAALRLAFPSIEQGSRVAFLMRFGWAPPPSTRVGRRPLGESVE